jgi:hypothetical protein
MRKYKTYITNVTCAHNTGNGGVTRSEISMRLERIQPPDEGKRIEGRRGKTIKLTQNRKKNDPRRKFRKGL